MFPAIRRSAGAGCVGFCLTEDGHIMHEYSIAEHIRDILTEVAGEHGRRVTAATIRIGPISMIVPELLHEAWAAVSAETPLAGSILLIEHVPITARCEECGSETTSYTPFIKCQQCGSMRLKLASGHELQVVDAELEDSIDESAIDAECAGRQFPDCRNEPPALG